MIKFNNIELASDGRDGVACNVRQTNQRSMDVVPLVQSAHPSITDRGNTYSVLTFSVERGHASILTARAFVLGRDEQVSGQGLVEIREEIGTELLNYWLPNAVVALVTVESRGTRSYESYRITYTEKLTEDPTA